MKFTLFADFIEQFEYKDSGNGKIEKESLGYVFQTPDDQLAPLIPYAIGKYLPLVSSSDNNTNTWLENIGIKGFLDKNITGWKDVVNKFLGWQMPPGGFKADIQYIDSVQTGTLMLRIGPYYRLKNLVIQDIQLNYSKQTAKYLDRDTGKIKTCPLYCDVFITLTPVNKYSDEMLKKFITKRGNVYEKENLTNSLKNMENQINNNLGRIL